MPRKMIWKEIKWKCCKCEENFGVAFGKKKKEKQRKRENCKMKVHDMGSWRKRYFNQSFPETFIFNLSNPRQKNFAQTPHVSNLN